MAIETEIVSNPQEIQLVELTADIATIRTADDSVIGTYCNTIDTIELQVPVTVPVLQIILQKAIDLEYV